MILNLKEIYGASWNVFAKNWISFILFTIVLALFGGIPFIGQFLMFAVFFAILKSLRGETISFKGMFNFKAIFNNATILLSVILVLISIFMFLNTSIIISYLFAIIILVLSIILYPIFCVAIDKNLNFIDAVKYSANLTKGARFDIIIVMIVNFFIATIGLMIFLVGSLVAIPIIVISTACVYLALENKVQK